jgi:hypothetical protein
MTGVASGERYGTPSLLQLLRFQNTGAASLFQAGLFFIGRPAEVDMVGVDSDEQYGLFAITGGASNEIAYDAYPGRGAVENLVFYAGNSRGLQFTIYNVDTSVTPAVKTVRDITLDTIKWAISKSKGGKYSKTPKLKKTSDPGGGITKIDAANGLVRVFLNNADSVKLKGTFHQELEAFDRFGESEVVAFGSVSILRNVRND